MSNTGDEFSSRPGEYPFAAQQGSTLLPPIPQVVSSSELTEDDWQASLPSWGDRIDVGTRHSGMAAATPPASAAPASQSAEAQPFVTPPPPPSSLLGTGFGLGPARMSGGMSLPAIDPNTDSEGLTQHSIARGSRFPTAPNGAPSSLTPAQSAYKNWTPPPDSGNTAAVWWIVLLPLIYTAIMVALFFVMLASSFVGLTLPPSSELQLSDPAMQALLGFVALEFALGLAYMAITIWMGYRDRRALLSRGFTTAASPWWNLLSQFIYLIIRTVRVRRITGADAAPLVVFIVLYFLPPFVAVIAAIGVPLYLSSFGS